MLCSRISVLLRAAGFSQTYGLKQPGVYGCRFFPLRGQPRVVSRSVGGRSYWSNQLPTRFLWVCWNRPQRDFTEVRGLGLCGCRLGWPRGLRVRAGRGTFGRFAFVGDAEEALELPGGVVAVGVPELWGRGGRHLRSPCRRADGFQADFQLK
jgi:hypothetical protein